MRPQRHIVLVVCLAALVAAGCGRDRDRRGPVDVDGSLSDAMAEDGGVVDAGPPDGSTDGAVTVDAGADGGAADGGSADGAVDAGVDAGWDGGLDAGWDAGWDAGSDAGFDAGWDAGFDAGWDAGWDAGPPDSGTGGCISGATGRYGVRFRWDGSYPGSTAYVVYEQNDLPDTSRWHVSAASTYIGYTPVYDDTYLGAGGLDLEGSAFIDVELSTVGLSSIANVTISVYGRSFNTTTSGSFTWQTFDGTGASPYGGIANSTPYEWYPADATAAFSPGDSGVLLRLRAGPPSGALIVNRVEICFDAP